ncbi:MAG: hypothetical protein IJ600_11700 [Lachnospiraceae bacterium]|nr:hypothetical protein [Lachnospiraceae bacterium]
MADQMNMEQKAEALQQTEGTAPSQEALAQTGSAGMPVATDNEMPGQTEAQADVAEAAQTQNDAAEEPESISEEERIDRYFQELTDAKRAVTAGIVVYKGRINEKLQERSAAGYDAIAAILNEPQYDRIAQYDEELTAFKSTGTIYRMEADSEKQTIYDKIEYVDDYRRLYAQMMFFLRRMQFGMDYSDCMMWLQEWGLTVHFTIQMLQECELGEKGKVTAILAGLYDAAGYRKEALYLLNVMLDHCTAQEAALIEEERRRLQALG